MSPEEFIRELCASCRVAEIAVGEDWHFGRGRAGDVETLRLLSGRYGFRVTAVPPILRDGERVSSTRIREAVRAADFLQAAGMLAVLPLEGPGDSWTPIGTPAGLPHGQYEARLRDCSLLHGVYAVRARVNGAEYGGVANLGVRPTVEGEGGNCAGKRFVGQPGDIYGQKEVVPVRFRGRKPNSPPWKN